MKQTLNQDDHPVAWSLWMDELCDAHEHLGKLIQDMTDAGSIDEADFGIDLGHVFAHLNRAWHSRDDPQLDNISQANFQKRSQYPTDLDPVG
ncbi:MAG: hypothetical protein AAGI68_13755 [Planctomycetota bacterium]